MAQADNAGAAAFETDFWKDAKLRKENETAQGEQ
jgi:hypothetical protein